MDKKIGGTLDSLTRHHEKEDKTLVKRTGGSISESQENRRTGSTEDRMLWTEGSGVLQRKKETFCLQAHVTR